VQVFVNSDGSAFTQFRHTFVTRAHRRESSHLYSALHMNPESTPKIIYLFQPNTSRKRRFRSVQWASRVTLLPACSLTSHIDCCHLPPSPFTPNVVRKATRCASRLTRGLNSAVLTPNEVAVGAVVIMANPAFYYIEISGFPDLGRMDRYWLVRAPLL
jgi:hypothetical protein